MTTDYGTGASSGKENLSGYFDVNNEGVSIKEGKPTTSWRFWSKKKKIIVVGTAVFLVLLLLIIIIAATAAKKTKKEAGEIPSVSSGQKCSGDSSKQNRCRSGECFENIFVCDGLDDCPGGEDEIKGLCREFKRKPRCMITQFQCAISRECIDAEKRCNSNSDCVKDGILDFSDERNCFTINPENSVISVIQNGVEIPMSAEVDKRNSDIICRQMGFRSLRFTLDGVKLAEGKHECATISEDYVDPDSQIIIDNIDTSKKCEAGALALICAHDACGVFGDYTGPVTPPSWLSSNMADAIKESNTRFPWVVTISNKQGRQCQGAIVNTEWVLTSLTCIKDDIFYTGLLSDAWTVTASQDPNNKQTRIISKVVRNHFDRLNRTMDADNLVAVQVFPPFEGSPSVHQVCLKQPDFLPRHNCFTAAYDKKSMEVKHVRIVPEANQTTTCNGAEQRDGVNCFTYHHSGDPDACFDAVGGPISCLDPATNSWTLSGVMSSKIGCSNDSRLAPSLRDQYNYYWASVITSQPKEFGKECEGKAQFQGVRLSRGIREGEFYVDVFGWGKYQSWHTVYNVSSAFDMMVSQLKLWEYTPTVRVIRSGTGITSRSAATLSCPVGANDLCLCKVKFVPYSPTMGEAQTLHFVDDANGDNRVDFQDYVGEVWDKSNTVDDQYDDYDDDDDSGERIGIDEVLKKGEPAQCLGIPDGRMCANSSVCIPAEFVCDSHIDCEDGTDELREKCEKYHGSKCNSKMFKCKTTYDCQPWSNRCDGTPDCIDGSDESECVRVMKDKTVFVEQNGLSLPLSGLPPATSNDAKLDLGVTLCELMGHGQFIDLQNKDATEKDFGLGCYKLNVESDGDNIIVHRDFQKHEAKDCNTTLNIICGRPRCGTTKEHQGPMRPSDWPADDETIIQVTNTENKDYPWVVHVLKESKPICSATILLPKWVVTSGNCIDELTRDLTVEFTDITSDRKIHQVTRKADYSTENIHPKNGEKIQRNIALLSVDPPFDLNSISHPLCLIPPLYVPDSYCQVSGHNADGNVVHVRVKRRSSKECEENKVPLKGPEWDYQCVKVIPTIMKDGKTNVDGCIKTKGSAVQCLDALRNRFSFTAVMSQNIGKGCEDEGSDRGNTLYATATNMGSMLPWLVTMVDDRSSLQNVTCREGSETHMLTYRQSHYLERWYITTDNGLAVKWDIPKTLTDITASLISFFGSGKVTPVEGAFDNAPFSENITSMDSLTLSNCDEEFSCDCLMSTPENKAEGVMEFYVVGVDTELNPEEGYQDSDGVIYKSDTYSNTDDEYRPANYNKNSDESDDSK